MNKLNEQPTRVSPKRTSEKVRLLTAEDLLSIEPTPSGSDRQLPFQELVIEGLLSFGEKTCFQFGQLNILVGPNGSGKSNLIDCVRVFRSAPLDICRAPATSTSRASEWEAPPTRVTTTWKAYSAGRFRISPKSRSGMRPVR